MNSTPFNQRRVIRVASSTYFVVGFIAAVSFIAGIGLLAEGQIVFGALCLALSPAIFYFFCFQKLVLEAGLMSFVRPFLGEKRVDLRRVSRVAIVLESAGEGFTWRCRIFDGGVLLCEFNPKLFPLAGIAAILAEIRTYAPAAVIEDGTAGIRTKKTPNQPPEPTRPAVTDRADARSAPADRVAHL